jgi:hypothetical protein
MPFSANSLAASSGMVMSGSASTHPTRASRCDASLPPPGGRPCRPGSTDPVRATRAASLTAKLALTLKRSAAIRRDSPASISPWTRSRSSIGCGFPMHAGLHPSQHLESDVRSLGNPLRFRFQARCSKQVAEKCPTVFREKPATNQESKRTKRGRSHASLLSSA